ncbi:MAG TPA: Gldg family protein [Verrucomicrobiae bacterium]|nr:Gldg family protein [Verrucomicrobiae bacterium]
MKTQMTDANDAMRNKRLNRGGARVPVLLLVTFAAGLLAGGYVHYRYSNRQAIAAVPTDTQTLSDATLAVLQRLDAPVEIRFYAPSTFEALPEATVAFAARVQELLSEYERLGGDKIRVAVSDPGANAAAKTSASNDGLLPLADNNGGVFYLGITVAQQGRTETIAQLSADWESALESDLSRAIARVGASTAAAVAPVAQAAPVTATVDPALSEKLVRTIPDFEKRSFDDAAGILREASLAEFTLAVREMESKVQEAQKQLAAAKESGSEADQQTAFKQLQQVQSEQTEKLKGITTELQVRIAALECLKGVSRSRRR